MKKNEFKHLQTLIIAQSVLLASLVQDMNSKGLIDGDSVMEEYENNLKAAVKELSR